MDEHITFKEAAANRLDQAKKAFWSIQGAVSSVPGDAYKKIFESLVAPVLDYCSPIWSHSLTHSSLERLKQHVYRFFLGVGRNHALAAAAGDLCWMPTACRHQQQLILLWLSLTKMDGNRMCRKIYQTARTYAESNGIENWASCVKTVLLSCGLFQWWGNNNCSNLSKKE